MVVYLGDTDVCRRDFPAQEPIARTSDRNRFSARTLTCLAIVVAAIVAGCAGDLLPRPESVADVQTPSPMTVATASPTAEPTEAASPISTDTAEPRTPAPRPTSTAVDIDRTATPVEPSPVPATPSVTTTRVPATPSVRSTRVPATSTEAPAEIGTPVVFGNEIDFPDGVAMIVSVGCADCEGATKGLIRVHKGPDAEILVDSLFSVENLDLPPRSVQVGDESLEADPYILGAPAISRDGAEVVVGICTRGHCGPDTAAVTSDAQVAAYRSVDGGVSWSKLVDLDGAYEIVEVVREGIIVYGPLGSDESTPEFTVYPGGERVRPPWAGGSPITLQDRKLIWQQRTDPNLLRRGDGSAFMSLGLPNDTTLLDFVQSPFNDQIAVLWTVSQQTIIGLVDSEGQLTQSINFRDRMVAVGGWLTAGQLIVTADFPKDQLETQAVEPYAGALPGVLDLDSGNMQPISSPFAEAEFQQGRSELVATVRGPFARVVNTGGCLNLRAEPTLDAEILRCLADNVLLLDTGETARGADVTWLRVVAPLGLEGWASTAFLKR